MNILTKERMMQVIWDAGVKYEGTGGDLDDISQLMRFQWIAEAQVRETLKMAGEWLDKWWETGKMGKQDWYEFEAFIQNTKRGELPLNQSGEE